MPRKCWIGPLNLMMTGAKTIDTMLISLIRMFSEGPEVSLQGSPTVSPMTAAPWVGFFEPSGSFLPPWAPFSMYFLALSHAPPALFSMVASRKPVTSPPASSPTTPGTPRISPVTTGTMIAISAGTIISRWAPAVEMLTQRA